MKAGKKGDAVKYARKHFSTDEPEHLELVKQVIYFGTSLLD